MDLFPERKVVFELMNFRSKKTQRVFAVVIIAVLVIAMILPMVVSAFA